MIIAFLTCTCIVYHDLIRSHLGTKVSAGGRLPPAARLTMARVLARHPSVKMAAARKAIRAAKRLKKVAKVKVLSGGPHKQADRKGKSKQSTVHLGGGVTHQLMKDISDITALLGALIADILGERKLAGGCTGEDIYVTQVFILRYECMAALKEYHWDAKGNTYGNLLIRIGEDDYRGFGSAVRPLLAACALPLCCAASCAP